MDITTVVLLILITLLGSYLLFCKLNSTKQDNHNPEDEFLKDALKGYIKYKSIGAIEQSDAYRLLINTFTKDK